MIEPHFVVCSESGKKSTGIRVLVARIPVMIRAEDERSGTTGGVIGGGQLASRDRPGDGLRYFRPALLEYRPTQALGELGSGVCRIWAPVT